MNATVLANTGFYASCELLTGFTIRVFIIICQSNCDRVKDVVARSKSGGLRQDNPDHLFYLEFIRPPVSGNGFFYLKGSILIDPKPRKRSCQQGSSPRLPYREGGFCVFGKEEPLERDGVRPPAFHQYLYTKIEF